MGTGEFGVDSVRANIEPERGRLHSADAVATDNNQWRRFVTVVTPIDGGVVKADGSNAGNVRIGGPGDHGPSCYPLDAGETMSISIDDLSKIYLYFETLGDRAYFEVITDTGD